MSEKTTQARPTKRPSGPSVFAVLRPYSGWIAALTVLTIAGNGVNLAIPKIISHAIDAYGKNGFSLTSTLLWFGVASFGLLVFTFAAGLVQTMASERVARDLRMRVAEKISQQSYAKVQTWTPAKLLTILTSDVDAVKSFVAMAVASMISSVFVILAASILLLSIDWKLALAVLLVLPIITATFTIVFGRVRVLFKQTQEAIDWLNKVINESILGAALVRLLNTQQIEYQKFLSANTEAKNISLKILNLFATLVPIVTFATNLATLLILVLGGRFVITGDMTLGSFTAFNSYLIILIFPLVVIGFMSNVIAQASASYGRILEVLNATDDAHAGTVVAPDGGGMSMDGVSVVYGNTTVVKDVSFVVPSGTKTAIIGPTAAGKTQLLYVLTGLVAPSRGRVLYADQDVHVYDPTSLHQRIGFVFQDSIIFNLSLRENIAFRTTVSDADLALAIETSELKDFVEALPDGLDTIVSERGASLSGGQKQRIMLARALALRPSVLLLDDFTARVDPMTEQKILENIQRNYPGMTIISVTQKVASVAAYDQIILLMEGELLAMGTYDALMETSPEFVQIAESQRTMTEYDV